MNIMKTFFILASLLISNLGLTQSKMEEAIILNQELEFLEDSVTKTQEKLSLKSAFKQKERLPKKTSLEQTYFGEKSSEDEVSTRKAARRKRGF